jgi:hypothetical protein
MRFVGPMLNNDRFWGHNFHNSRATLDLLMGPSSKSISLRTIHPIVIGLMGKKNVVHEQHGYGGPLWVVHIFEPQVPTMTLISFVS